jgi:hypothetical protein
MPEDIKKIAEDLKGKKAKFKSLERNKTVLYSSALNTIPLEHTHARRH